MDSCANNEGPTLAAVRERLREMTDAQLEEHGKAYMNSPEALYGETLQLAEARAEWKRRKASQAQDCLSLPNKGLSLWLTAPPPARLSESFVRLSKSSSVKCLRSFVVLDPIEFPREPRRDIP